MVEGRGRAGARYGAWTSEIVRIEHYDRTSLSDTDRYQWRMRTDLDRGGFDV
jgi:hypothetical protein